jgi:TPR repeat protein
LNLTLRIALSDMKKLLLLLLLLPALAFAQPDFDETKALAEQGDAEAQFNLAYMYGTGNGVPKNDAEAVRWSTTPLFG